jgi:hypothetical protein
MSFGLSGNLDNASANFVNFDPDGTLNPNGALSAIVVSGAIQGDSTFSVPGASGCGPNGNGTLDAVVNAVVGLPSPSGANVLVLDDASSALVLPSVPLTGQEFSDAWHTASTRRTSHAGWGPTPHPASPLPRGAMAPPGGHRCRRGEEESRSQPVTERWLTVTGCAAASGSTHRRARIRRSRLS